MTARFALDGTEPDSVLRIDDEREAFGGRVVGFDTRTAAGATVREIDGTLVYVPARGFVGVDRFRVRVDNGRYEFEVVATVSVSRPGDADARTGTADRGANDFIDGSVLGRLPVAGDSTGGADQAAGGEMALTDGDVPPRAVTLVALIALLLLGFGMSVTSRG